MDDRIYNVWVSLEEIISDVGGDPMDWHPHDDYIAKIAGPTDFEGARQSILAALNNNFCPNQNEYDDVENWMEPEPPPAPQEEPQ
jgi:hypothetical protein